MSYKSLTINERYNILKEFGKIEKENTDALIQWRNDMSLLSQKQLVCTHVDAVFLAGQFFQGKLSNFGKPVIITFQRDIVLFTPDLICQSGGPALPYYIQPVLKFHLFVWSQRRKIHKPAP